MRAGLRYADVLVEPYDPTRGGIVYLVRQTEDIEIIGTSSSSHFSGEGSWGLILA